MKNHIIALVGMAGSGKSLAADFLVKQGYGFLRFGQITLDEAKKRGVSGEAAEREIREGFRKEYGMAAFALLNMPKLDELLEKNNVVVDGLYSWAEYKVLKEKYGNKLKVIAVYAPPELRHQRLENRNIKEKNDASLRFRSFTKEEAVARDFAEIEKSDKGGPIAMADFTIVNTRSVDNLESELRQILKAW
ncbi:AAA family ATPase [Candidatus Gribaldobacteria bacterium]|nr:AAA family ATPase [Candidatus Gribaldobacteria bacterium]